MANWVSRSRYGQLACKISCMRVSCSMLVLSEAKGLKCAREVTKFRPQEFDVLWVPDGSLGPRPYDAFGSSAETQDFG